MANMHGQLRVKFTITDNPDGSIRISFNGYACNCDAMDKTITS